VCRNIPVSFVRPFENRSPTVTQKQQRVQRCTCAGSAICLDREHPRRRNRRAPIDPAAGRASRPRRVCLADAQLL